MYNFEVYSDLTYTTATSYISVQELKDISSGDIFVNFKDVDTVPDADIENSLVNATKILDGLFTYNGEKQLIDQKLKFPRDFDVPPLTISDNIKIATAYVAASISNGTIDTILISDPGVQVKKEKADVLEMEYFEGGSKSVFSDNPYLKQLLEEYTGNTSSGGGLFVNVSRTL